MRSNAEEAEAEGENAEAAAEDAEQGAEEEDAPPALVSNQAAALDAGARDQKQSEQPVHRQRRRGCIAAR